ncbi:ribonuclease YeeF family protein [Bacillus sp. ISL-78]|uniref:ribonuclease YeeF family protein n=2 Tax=unclassified Bacillus (in: firmicutes) TaxID=185979 RepID=UPI001BEC7BE0|nr:T7SS effector LXG polymorphic toxin [Bacillus sp. ISL-78]MBT2614243.1 ribonuclease YeeF family protein [Bacillus sp. ISL-78]
MKIYEAETLTAATKSRAKQYEELKKEVAALKKEFQGIVGLDNEFQGAGATAIKSFYEAQIEVADAWMELFTTQISFLEGIPASLEEADLSGNTVVEVPFLDGEVSNGINQSKSLVDQQANDLQRILNSIDDILPLDVFDQKDFNEKITLAGHRLDDTVTKVENVDRQLVEEYDVSIGQENVAVGLFRALLDATKQDGNISPMTFNQSAFKNSDVYQVKDEVAGQMKDYQTFKKEQAEARKIEQEMEELENRPWYEKAWDTTKTFTGEFTGYYDSIRASTGVDPVTGRKLSDAERIAAGAMAAAGFIPVVGWAGRAIKGGSAIYKTAKGLNAANHALDAYKTTKGFSLLQKTEYGIYGLLAANGLGEAVTGKDMFGNQLTEEQRQNGLLMALGIGGVAGAAKYVDHLQAKNAIYQTTDLLKENKVVRKYAKEIAKHPNPKPVEDVLKYVIKKQNSIGTKVMLDGEVVEKVLKEVKPNITIRELENLKWSVIEEATLKNKTILQPSQRARLWQGSHPYFGIDTYEDIILKKGTILFAGYPRPTGYCFTKEVLDSVDGDSKKLFQGVQVNPREFDDGTGDYKFQVIKFELMDDLPSARGMTDANPQLGSGGLEQIFTPDFEDLLREGKVNPVLDDVTKQKLRGNGIEFNPILLQQKDESGKYMYETISKTFVEIAEDPNVIKLKNFKLTKAEMDEINEAIENADLFEMGIR